MKTRLVIPAYTSIALTLVLLLTADIAHAQFRPRPIEDPATGERYHVEASAGFWFPAADMTISSQRFGLAGTTIDFKRDLGLIDQRFSELHLVLRPGKHHKFRLQYIPILYDQTAVIPREIIFNGQRYVVGLPVNSTLDWKAYRVGYEYDFISRDRGYGGFVLDIKYTDVTATLAAPTAPREFTRERVPIPALGGIFRVYPVPNVSITGEVTGFTLPDNLIKGLTMAHYVDIDFYGTLNFTNYIGAQAGYRSFDVGYLVSDDTGSFKLKGWYFGVVARY